MDVRVPYGPAREKKQALDYLSNFPFVLVHHLLLMILKLGDREENKNWLSEGNSFFLK